MERLGAVVGELRGLPHVELRDEAGVGHGARIRGEQAGHVLPERDLARAQGTADQDGGDVGSAAAQGGELSVRSRAEEPGHDRDGARAQEGKEHAARGHVRRLQVGGGVAELAVRTDELQGIHVGGGSTRRVQGRGEQVRGEPLAARDQLVLRARGQLAHDRDALGQGGQLRHRGVDHGEDRVQHGPGYDQRARHLGVLLAQAVRDGGQGLGIADPGLLRALQEQVRRPGHRRHHDHELAVLLADDAHGVREGRGVRQ